MSGEVTAQVDVGSLTLQGLASFAPMLAAISADDVSPLALIQLSQLGSHFHVSGPHAARVSDLLRRCVSTRLDKLGIVIGWRKGDAASFMAETAGGQAVALLCFCLLDLAGKDIAGAIIFDLSERALRHSSSISSMKQLADVASLLSSKLAPLGFGNILAAQAMRIHRAYDHLSSAMPTNFFDQLTRDATVELFYGLSKVFTEEDCLVRISGTQAMAYIATMVSILFPTDVTMTVEGFIIHEGTRRSILVEIGSVNGAESPTIISVERKLSLTSQNTIPLRTDIRMVGSWDHPHRFAWPMHMADSLTISFACAGLSCPQELIAACCDVIAHTASTPDTSHPSPSGMSPPSSAFIRVLGSNWSERISQTCKAIFGAMPTDPFPTRFDAFSNLLKVFESALGKRLCTNARNRRRDHYTSFENRRCWACKEKGIPPGQCITRKLWHDIRNAIGHGLGCALVKASSNTTLVYNAKNRGSMFPNLLRDGSSAFWRSCADLHRSTMAITDAQNSPEEGYLAQSDGCSSIFPASFRDLRYNIDDGCWYFLCEGRLMLKDRFYTAIISSFADSRMEALDVPRNAEDVIKPSPAGAHTNLHFTLRESPNFLELRTSMAVQGQNINLSLTEILVAALSTEDADACGHDIDGRLDRYLHPYVITTSLAAPRAPDGGTAIVQTKSNPTAQLLACSYGERSLLQRSCCLNCAVAQAREKSKWQLSILRSLFGSKQQPSLDDFCSQLSNLIVREKSNRALHS